LGSVVTKNLVAVLGDAILSRAYPDLLIAYGLIYQDIAAILAGAQGSIHKNGISPAMVCAVEWLTMAMDMLNSGQRRELSEATEIKQLLQALHFSLDNDNDSAVLSAGRP
jgi:hypothetical protein